MVVDGFAREPLLFTPAARIGMPPSTQARFASGWLNSKKWKILAATAALAPLGYTVCKIFVLANSSAGNDRDRDRVRYLTDQVGVARTIPVDRIDQYFARAFLFGAFRPLDRVRARALVTALNEHFVTSVGMPFCIDAHDDALAAEALRARRDKRRVTVCIGVQDAFVRTQRWRCSMSSIDAMRPPNARGMKQTSAICPRRESVPVSS